jgi:transposase
MSYSEDYRMAAIKYKKEGHTFKELKEVFKITPRTYYKWGDILEKTGSACVKIKQTRKRKIDNKALEKAVKEKPDAYLRELSKQFNCSISAIHRRLVKLGFTYKKKLLLTQKNPKKLDQSISKK